MKASLLIILIGVFVLASAANSEILVFKNGQKIETNYRWDVPPDKIGFFYNGQEYHAKKSDIDWKKTQQVNKAKLKETKTVQVVSFEDFTRHVEKNMGARYQIRSVAMEDQRLKVTTALRSLDEQTYNQMVAQVCGDLKDYPEVAKRLKEVIFLSKWETQGWVFASPENYSEILAATPEQLATVVAGHSRAYKPN